MKRYRKLSLNDETMDALLKWATYIARRTDRPMSLAATVRWLATATLKIKEGHERQGKDY